MSHMDNDPAFAVMAMDILSNVLSRSDNPGDLGTYLTEEIRDLTGARCALLIQCLSTPTVISHRVVGINPLRRREWAESPDGSRLCGVVCHVPATRVWRGEEPSEIAGLLRREGFELSMVFPLNAGELRVGAMLVLGLPDEEHITSVLSLLDKLSTIVALVLRNAMLYEKQEQLVQERTAELRDSNEKLAIELTERKRAEDEIRSLNASLEARVRQRTQELAESEERMRLFFERQLVGMAITSPKKGWLQVNDKLCQMLGYSREELTRLTWAEMTYPEDLAPDVAQFERLLNGEIDGYMLEKRFLRKDGGIVFTNLAVGCVRQADRAVNYVLALLEDITERKRAEEAIRTLNATLEERVLKRTTQLKEAIATLNSEVTERKRAEEALRVHKEHLEELVKERTTELVAAKEAAEAANRAKSIFLASMSHELRTPLNAVMGFSQLMRTDPTLNESQKENLNIINRSGTHLLGLINDVLEVSRIEAGRVTREETNFDLWDTLETIKEMVRVRAKAKGLRFRLERDPTLPRYVRADERKLKQVILNLAGNAVKFTRQGDITLRARAENGGAILRFEVEDTGPGIDAKTIPMLFAPFVQGGQNWDGVGLGLFISQKLVEFMGGRITVRSEPGKGALFSFDILCEPVTAMEIAPQEACRRVAGLAPGQRPPRILVAEDIPESRLLMTKTLWSTGFEVVEAENGIEAVQLFEQRQPDLVLMDMRMPVMDGYEAIQAIRATQRGKTTPIIAVTASAFEEDRQKILAIGANDFVRKPMQAAELFEKIRLLLGIAYIYAEEQAGGAEAFDHASLSEMATQLPEDLNCELARAMAVLDLDGFKALLPKVTQHHPLLAEKLGGLANGYRVTDLAELFPTETRGA